MFQELTQLTGNETWDELRQRFAAALGLPEPLPSAVLRRALVDNDYAHRLLVSRNAPGFLRALIADPKNRRYEPLEPPPVSSAPAMAAPAPAPKHTNLELAGRAAKAMLQWGKSGFTQVDEETFARRMAACQACPNFVDPREKLAYKLLSGRAADGKICALCGCVTARKARIPTESCPGADPNDPTRTRWGDPRRVAAAG